MPTLNIETFDTLKSINLSMFDDCGFIGSSRNFESGCSVSITAVGNVSFFLSFRFDGHKTSLQGSSASQSINGQALLGPGKSVSSATAFSDKWSHSTLSDTWSSNKGGWLRPGSGGAQKDFPQFTRENRWIVRRTICFRCSTYQLCWYFDKTQEHLSKNNLAISSNLQDEGNALGALCRKPSGSVELLLIDESDTTSSDDANKEESWNRSSWKITLNRRGGIIVVRSRIWKQSENILIKISPSQLLVPPKEK